ncbi:flagellar hook-associated protein FlgK [Clostridia bacterium OttesenSCG-928-F22]|nr:flagellar hook-associated protein FlgK [Clostridia bacterium OttesenSCG-928-F22]
MSSFYGLNIAKTGLFMSQRALNVTGHNIANVNTEGYTRQRYISASIDPASSREFLQPYYKGRVGGGVEPVVLDQIRDSFIDRELRREYAGYAHYSTRADTLMYIESIFNETSDSSISKTLANFFDSLQDLSPDAASKELRTNVIQNGIKLTETFNHYHKQLLELQKVQNESMKVTTDNINDILTGIADFNKQIFVFEIAGEKANDLRDKRNLLLDELSGLIDIEYTYDDFDRLSITCGGQELMYHTDYTKLKAVPSTTPSPVTGQLGFYDICLDNGKNTKLNYTNGEMEAYRVMRDGDSPDEIGIPRMIDNLNILARTIAEQFNKIHETGYTYEYGGNASVTGVKLFEVPAGGYADITAENFKLDDIVKNDPYKIACSSVKIELTIQPPKHGNNEVLLEMIALASSESVPLVGNFEGFLKTTILEVSVESGHIQKLASSQEAVSNNLLTRRESISGVSIDEEVVTMLQYQHMYSASSRMINAIDEALDILINKTGLVGRS